MDLCLVHCFSVCLVGWCVQTIFVNWPSQMDAACEIVMMINTLVHKQNKLKAKEKKKISWRRTLHKPYKEAPFLQVELLRISLILVLVVSYVCTCIHACANIHVNDELQKRPLHFNSHVCMFLVQFSKVVLVKLDDC